MISFLPQMKYEQMLNVDNLILNIHVSISAVARAYSIILNFIIVKPLIWNTSNLWTPRDNGRFLWILCVYIITSYR